MKGEPSRGRKLRQAAQLGRMKSQYDVLTWHAGAQKDVGKPLIGFVGLDPNLAIFDAKVKRRFLHATVVIPTEIHQNIVSVVVIENSLDLNSIMARPANVRF